MYVCVCVRSSWRMTYKNTLMMSLSDISWGKKSGLWEGTDKVEVYGLVREWLGYSEPKSSLLLHPYCIVQSSIDTPVSMNSPISVSRLSIPDCPGVSHCTPRVASTRFTSIHCRLPRDAVCLCQCLWRLGLVRDAESAAVIWRWSSGASPAMAPA